AVGDAKATAETVAKAAGVRVVKIVRISPSYEVPGPVYRDFLQAKVAAAESAPTPIEPGELTVSATVNIVYEIE
ncbi:MAG: SIMPL domain-containing protein, partial [Thermodesulfobacteriota bacterium]